MNGSSTQPHLLLSLLALAVGWTSAATTARADAAAEAQTLFTTRCSPCHGLAGAGDGIAAAALIPKPRDLSAAEWQGSVTDDHISRVIRLGGPAVGLSPLMPPNPDLVEKPDVVAALVAQVRGFGPEQPPTASETVAGTDPAPATPPPTPEPTPATPKPAAATTTAAAGTGEQIFKTVCAACHTVNAGRLVGPDLAGVHQRRERDWLRRFVKSSQTMVTGGDPVAVELFTQFNNVPMPDNNYSERQIDEILDFIGKLSDEGGVFSLVPVAPRRAATAEEIDQGLNMFQGRHRFANGGPACNSCHHVKNDAVIGGGVLAKELTSVFSRLGAPGVQAILGMPPFPVMEQAYANKALTEDEIFSLVAFLEEADEQQAFQQPRDYGVKLFASGLVGLVVLMGLYSLVWRRRKRRSVNHDIYARQVRTT